jgi:predicted neutral ceramidase superfamily lipid hydrolase
MICPICHSKIPDDSYTCIHCDHVIKDPPKKNTPEYYAYLRQQKRNKENKKYSESELLIQERITVQRWMLASIILHILNALPAITSSFLLVIAIPITVFATILAKKLLPKLDTPTFLLTIFQWLYSIFSVLVLLVLLINTSPSDQVTPMNGLLYALATVLGAIYIYGLTLWGKYYSIIKV